MQRVFLVLLFVGSGCETAEVDNPCSGVSCGAGRCVEVVGEAVCLCDPGFEATQTPGCISVFGGDSDRGDSSTREDGGPGDVLTGDGGDTSQGDTFFGDTLAGDAQTGDAQTGDTQTGDTQTGDTNTGDIILGGDTFVQPPPPDPINLSATPDGAASAVIVWTSGGGTTADYRLAYSEGSVPPAGCTGPFVISEDDIDAALPAYVVFGLRNGADYTFRVCAIDDAQPPRVSDGAIITGRALGPPSACDFTSPGGTLTFDDIEADIATATSNDVDGDIVVCYPDGTMVLNDDAIGQDSIRIATDNVVLYVPDGVTAIMQTNRITGVFDLNSIINVFNADNAWIHNWTLRLYSGFGAGVVTNGSATATLTKVNIEVTGSGGRGISFQNSSELVLSDVVIDVDADAAFGIYTAGPPLNLASHLRVDVAGDDSIGIFFTSGPAARLHEVTLRRTGNTGVGVGLAFTAGVSVVSSLVSGLTICAMDPTRQWTHNIADYISSGVYTEPIGYVAYPTGVGAETVPFEPPESDEQRVSLGLLCP